MTKQQGQMVERCLCTPASDPLPFDLDGDGIGELCRRCGEYISLIWAETTDTDTYQTPQEPRTEPRRWEEVLAPSYTSEPASERSQRLQRPRWLDRAAKDLTGDLKR